MFAVPNANAVSGGIWALQLYFWHITDNLNSQNGLTFQHASSMPFFVLSPLSSFVQGLTQALSCFVTQEKEPKY